MNPIFRETNSCDKAENALQKVGAAQRRRTSLYLGISKHLRQLRLQNHDQVIRNKEKIESDFITRTANNIYTKQSEAQYNREEYINYIRYKPGMMSRERFMLVARKRRWGIPSPPYSSSSEDSEHFENSPKRI